MQHDDMTGDRRQGRGVLWALAGLALAVALAFYLRPQSTVSPQQVLQDTGASKTRGQEQAADPATPMAQTAAKDEAAQPPAADRARPTIEEVRLEGDGVLVVAGRAEPGDVVGVLVEGREIARGVTDASGSFAAIAFVDPSDRPLVLSLLAQNASGGLASLDQVILAPRTVGQENDAIPEENPALAAGQSGVTPESVTGEAPQEAGDDRIALSASSRATGAGSGAASTDLRDAGSAGDSALSVSGTGDMPGTGLGLSDAGRDPVAGAAVVDGVGQQARAEPGAVGQISDAGMQDIAGSGATASENAAVSAPTPDAPAVALLKSTEAGVTLLQPELPIPDSVALDTIGYSDSGVVRLSGRVGTGAKAVQIYLDNRPVARLVPDERGGWRGEVPDVATGVYRLRVDALDAAGDVTSRIETPFKREEPDVLAAAGRGPGGAEVRVVTVQTGDTLWAIARQRYGEGVLYLQVFDANRDAIRDPDLIYPGQVFGLPEN